MITDTHRLAWLAARVTYLEHKDKNDTLPHKLGRGEGGYWPQSEDDPSECQNQNLCDMSLMEFIDANIRMEMDK